MCLGAVGGCIGANLAYNGGASDGGVIIMAMLMAMLLRGCSDCCTASSQLRSDAIRT